MRSQLKSRTHASYIVTFALMMSSIAVFASEEAGTIQSFKGWELYSWKCGSSWKFSLLTGTNRTKFCTEIKNPKQTLTTAQLDSALAKLAPLEYVSWLAKTSPRLTDGCALALPPASIVQRVKNRCTTSKLNLTIDR